MTAAERESAFVIRIWKRIRYTVLIMISLIAGVSEESGFRGYIRGPLQRVYGPVFAIGLSALLFWAAHLNHANGVARFPALFTMGIALGVLTFSSRSIVPSILTHVLADSVAFVFATAGIGPAQLWRPQLIKNSGIDRMFVATLLVTLITGCIAFFVLNKLAAIRSLEHANDESTGSSR
jgi:hypothetical protein